MAYVAGDTITAAQYNIFVNNSSSPYGYNHFAGTGSGVYGLGQSTLSTVAATNTITAAQFNSLFTAMTNLANHTNDTLTSTTAVATGDTIAIKAALEADIATLAASVAAGCPNATALTTSAALQTVTTASASWDTSATQEVSVTFADADTMRHYFNAGGKVRVTVGVVAIGGVNLKDDAFADLGTAIGNFDIGATSCTRSGSGETETTFASSTGFHDLTTSYTTLIKLTSDNADYTSNTVEIQAKLDAAVGTAVTMTIKMIATDPAEDQTWTANNTDGVGSDPSAAPQMVTTLYTLSPNTSEGLGTALGISSSATVSNTTA